MHFSDYYNLEIDGHADIEFVDINLRTDTKLFLDPFLIESKKSNFASRCSQTINSFFKEVFACCKSGDDKTLRILLEFGHEPNETRLGLSRNQSGGRGASSEILYSIFKQISWENFFSQGLIENYKDVCLFVENFAEDRMSDLITNILRKELYIFTQEQSIKYNISLNSETELLGNYWSPKTLSWEELRGYPLKVDSLPVLLVPKNFVRSKYLYSVREYLQHKIIVERQDYHRENKTSLAIIKQDKNGNDYYDKPSKKEVYKEEIKGRKHKEYVKEYSLRNPGCLIEFRKQMEEKLSRESWALTDEQLDILVYRRMKKVS